MRTKSVLLIALLLPLLALSGCSLLHRQHAQTDLEVLKTQLARQQSQMAEQQVLLQSLMSGQHEQASEQNARLAGIRDQLEELVLESRKRREEDAGRADKTCPVIDSRSNGQPCTDLTIIGGLEVIHLQPPGRNLVARVDTGANTSSLDARNIEMFESDGEDYVRFTLPPQILAKDQKKRYELPVSRFVRIIQAGKADERRAVIELKFRLGSVERMAEFTLTNREHLTYRALLGRNILRDFFAVDVANTFMISDEEDSDEDEDRADEDDEDDEDEGADEEEAGEDGADS